MIKKTQNVNQDSWKIGPYSKPEAQRIYVRGAKISNGTLGRVVGEHSISAMQMIRHAAYSRKNSVLFIYSLFNNTS